MKLQQYIAHAGVCSRRNAEEYIRSGRVTVNGHKITDVTARVDREKDHVKVDGRLLKQEQKVYILMNKPEGCITSVTDDQDRRTVVDLLKDRISQRIYPVGRLDFNTTGTLILTNDGDFANRIMHPKFDIPKRYVAKVSGRMTTFAINRLKKGFKLKNEDDTEGRFVKAADAGIYKRNDQNDLVYVTITEGMNHQVKRMLETVGVSVVRLKRENVGAITAKGMEPGQWRYMTPDEIEYFMRVKK
jgi:23S rRNA pseudouridine2605 synthase